MKIRVKKQLLFGEGLFFYNFFLDKKAIKACELEWVAACCNNYDIIEKKQPQGHKEHKEHKDLRPD